MKVLVVLSVLIAAAFANDAAPGETCCQTITKVCDEHQGVINLGTSECNAKYGLFKHADDNNIQRDLKHYVNLQIKDSFQYLLLSSIFGDVRYSRDGFKSLYRKLSDKSWDDAIDLIKFITKRGGVVDIDSGNEPSIGDVTIQSCPSTPLTDVTEIQSLSLALGIKKEQARKVLELHAKAQEHSTNKMDGSISHYLEERFMERQADDIRSLAGHITDLEKFLRADSNSHMSVFIFDEYLQKIV